MTLFSLFIYSLLSGLAGTVVITIIQEIEIRITGRALSYTPVEAVFKVLGLQFQPLLERTKVLLSYTVHFVYGIVWGVPLVVLYYLDLNWIQMYVIYFLVLWGQEILVFSLLGVGCPPWKWGIRTNLKEVAFKLVYSAVVVFTFLLFINGVWNG